MTAVAPRVGTTEPRHRAEEVRALLVGIDDERWAELALGRPDTTFFHDPRWARLLADCYGFEPHALLWIDGSGSPVAGLPLVSVRSLGRSPRWIALPFSDHCGIVGSGPDAADLVRAADAERIRWKAQSLEIRGSLGDVGGVYVERAVRHTVDLTPGAVEILRGMSRMHQGSLRKAERSNVRVVESASEGLEDFYRLHLRTRRRLGVPIQPKRFFSLIKERILDQGAGHVLTAKIDDRPVASGVFLTWGRSVIFKYAASDERSWDARPNHLLAWSAVRASCERGFLLFDWGRTDAENEGLRNYKRAFGSDEQVLTYSWIGSAPGPQTRPRLLARSAAAIIRHSPEWLCQTIGEKFYGFAS